MHPYIIEPGRQVTGFRRGAERYGTLRNSTGSNTHIPPHDMVYYEKSFVEGYTHTWGEYVPTTYTGEHPVPLVVCNHAGGVNAEIQFDETSWAIVAEQEGLIVVYPNATTPGLWLGAPDRNRKEFRNPVMDLMDSPTGTVGTEHVDVRFLCALIEEMKGKYNIDAGRIYMQGMSMGDIMTMQFSRIHGDMLAGAANAAGPSPEQVLFTADGALKAHAGPVPVYQSRGELDTMATGGGGYSGTLTRREMNSVNRRFWRMVNGCTEPPALAIRDFNNYAFYHGEKADLYYRDVKYRYHGQMLDDAETIWYQLFSGTRRMPDGSIQRSEVRASKLEDRNAAALSSGCKNVLIDNRLVTLDAPVEAIWLEHVTTTRDGQEHSENLRELLYVPLDFLTRYYGVQVRREDRKAWLTLPNGTVCQIADGSIGCMVDGEFRSMSRQSEWLHEQLYVPVQWFAVNLFGQYATQCDGSLYLSDHFGEMTTDMAFLIRETLEEA